MQHGVLGEKSGGGAKRFLAENPDLAVIGLWVLVAAICGFTRPPQYTGDGVRHLFPILTSNTPHIGAARWLLFPVFLHVVLRPFVWLHVANDATALAHIMLTMTVAAATLYAVAVRTILRALGVPAPRRAAALGVAIFSAAFLASGMDLMEPIFGATLIVCGAAYAARRCHDSGATDAQRRNAALVAIGSVAVATTLYEGLVFGLGLVFLVLPERMWRDRRLWIGGAVLLGAAALLTWGVLAADGRGLAYSFGQLARGGADNPAYTTMLKKPGLAPFVIALVGGPPQGVVSVGEFRGFNGLLAALKDPAQRRDGLEILGRFLVGASIVGAGFVAAVRRRDRALLIAFAVLMVMPLIRRQQYGYIKFWILLPVLLAVGAARARTWIAAAVAVVLFALHVPGSVAAFSEARRLYDDHMRAYARADANTCWLAVGWIPGYWLQWPGSTAPVLGTLSEGHGANGEEIMASARADMTAALRDCLCRSSSVFTDDMLPASHPVLTDLATHYSYTELDLTAFTLPQGQGEALNATAPIIYRYPPDLQRRLCGVVSAAQAAPR